MNKTEIHRKAEDTRYGDAIPCVRLDENMRILFAGESAKLAGVREGEYLPCPPHRDGHNFRLMHEIRLRHAERTVRDALCEPQYATHLPIARFHGFHIAYIVYEYALSGNTATAYLFRSVRQAVAAAPQLSRAAARHAVRLEEYLSRLREKCSAMLHTPRPAVGDSAESYEELMSTALFAMRTLSPLVTEEPDGGRLFFLGTLLRIYCDTVLPDALKTDCRILCDTLPDTEDLSLSVDAAAMCLLWTAAVKIASDVSDDRCIRISQHRFAEDCEIRITTVAPSLAARLSTVPSPLSLLPYVPSARPCLLLLDHLSGMQNCFAEILPDAAEGLISISLYMPAENSIPDFKSPEMPLAFRNEITAVCKTVLALSLDM